MEKVFLRDLCLMKVSVRWGEDRKSFYQKEGVIYKLVDKMAGLDFFYFSKGRKHLTGIDSIDIGFVDENTSPAFLGVLLQEDKVVGYAMKKGEKVESESELTSAFLSSVFRKTLSTGYAFADFGVNNIVRVDDEFSLIDYESSMVRLEGLDPLYNYKYGCYRKHILPAYKLFISSVTGVFPPVMLSSQFCGDHFRFEAQWNEKFFPNGAEFAFYIYISNKKERVFWYSGSPMLSIGYDEYASLSEKGEAKVQVFARDKLDHSNVFLDYCSFT